MKKFNVGDSVKLKDGRVGVVEDYDEKYYYIKDANTNIVKIRKNVKDEDENFELSEEDVKFLDYVRDNIIPIYIKKGNELDKLVEDSVKKAKELKGEALQKEMETYLEDGYDNEDSEMKARYSYANDLMYESQNAFRYHDEKTGMDIWMSIHDDDYDEYMSYSVLLDCDKNSKFNNVFGKVAKDINRHWLPKMFAFVDTDFGRPVLNHDESIQIDQFKKD